MDYCIFLRFRYNHCHKTEGLAMIKVVRWLAFKFVEILAADPVYPIQH